jgi:glutathione S-transferase
MLKEPEVKFYDCATAPSPRRVRIFLAEKGITLDTVQVDLRNGEQFTPAFRAINPDCTVPALALGDGTTIADAVAICGYLEELHPEPPLIGSTPQERAVVNALNRQIERDGFFAAMDAFRNTARGLVGRALPGPHDYAQIPELAERGRARIGNFFKAMNARLADREFVAGGRYTIADISTMVLTDMATGMVKLAIPDDCAHMRRWYEAVSARPSAKA